MRQSNGAIGFVDVLSAGSAGAIGIHADIFFIDIDFSAIGNFWRDIDCRETRLAFTFRIERADANQPMQTRFAFQIAVGHRSANRDRSIVDSGFVVVVSIEQNDRVVIFLCPAGVHPQHHFRPVIGIGSAIAGMNRQDRSATVVGTVEQRLSVRDHPVAFPTISISARISGSIDSSSAAISIRAVQIFAGSDQLGHWPDNGFQRFQSANRFLGGFLVIPEIVAAISFSMAITDSTLLVEVKDCLAVG